jgi:hypothetical protein
MRLVPMIMLSWITKIKLRTNGMWGHVRYTGRLANDLNSKLELEFKKMKILKNLKNNSRCVESNGVIFFQIFIHLVYFVNAHKNTKCTNI